MALFTGHTITPDSALGGVKIERSVRLNKADQAYFTRTVSTTGNQKVWTWSAWFKRTTLGTSSQFFTSYGNNDGIAAVYFDSSDRINTYFDTSGSNPYGAVNERRYRDTTSWMHIVWQVDAENTTQKIWINGVEESLSSSLNPPNFAYTMNQSGQVNTIGTSAWYVQSASNMYITEIHFSDGNKYAASDFGYTDAQTEQWRPKNGNVVKSNITYGTNGYWIDFRDNTSTTTLGYDYSGNGNHYTAANISVSAGYGNDSLEDTPTNNACVMNDQDDDGSATITNGSLQMTQASDPCRARGTHGMPPNTGKYYYEMTVQTGSSYNFGMKGTLKLGSGTDGNDGRYVYYGHNGYKYDDSSGGSYGASYGSGDTVAILYDSDSGEVYFYKNGASQGLAFTGVNNKTYLPFVYLDNYGTAPIVHWNFGQRPFAHTPPTGAKGLGGKYNVNPVPAGVVRPERHFECLTYTGNGGTQTISGLEFSPGLVWIKSRSSAINYQLIDTVRGATKRLQSNTTTEEKTNTNGLTAFTEDGFTVGDQTNVNGSGLSLVAWCWKAGGAGVSNSDGNITSTVSANQEAGFSIVTYTGNGTSPQTVGHGLGKAPAVVIVKDRDNSMDWVVKHQDLSSNKILYLQQTAAEDTGTGGNNGIVDNLTSATTTTVTLTNNGSGNMNMVNKSSTNYVMYCWAEIPGYSKFGTYKGTGNSNGAFVHLGFRAAWLMTKRINSARNWIIFDNKRDTDNPATKILEADQTSTDADINGGIDFLSDAFKIVTSDTDINGADTSGGDTYVFMAFAERPSGSMFGLDANAR